MLVHNMRGHAILKDAKTGKCLDVNSAHLDVYGLDKPKDLIGYTVWDVNNFMNKMWLDNAQQVAKFDEEVLYTGKPVVKSLRVWLNSQGMVWAHHMGKLPVMNSNKQVIAILGSSEDLTASLDLRELYQYYRYFYQNRKVAISKFLEHVGILNYFERLPTDAETLVLITKKNFGQNKLVAQYLKITEGTLESHIHKIINKLKLDCFNLNNILLDMKIIP
ncbi:MAG: hypothetical protein EKK54_12260 [Neisseriaceae bacterium]|nr:MAG: hypothetical protein EKK54_12260 [Neisseriaceae bacterium]